MTEKEAYVVGWDAAQHVRVEHVDVMMDVKETWSMLSVDCPHEIANNEVLHVAWMRGFDERCATAYEMKWPEKSGAD